MSAWFLDSELSTCYLWRWKKGSGKLLLAILYRASPDFGNGPHMQ